VLTLPRETGWRPRFPRRESSKTSRSRWEISIMSPDPNSNRNYEVFWGEARSHADLESSLTRDSPPFGSMIISNVLCFVSRLTILISPL